jgi:hypothetical protein
VKKLLVARMNGIPKKYLSSEIVKRVKGSVIVWVLWIFKGLNVKVRILHNSMGRSIR